MLSLLVRSTVPAVFGIGAGLVAIVVIVYVAFGRALWLPALPAALAWLGAAALTNQLLHAASNRARAQLRQSFERYLPPAVIDRMVRADALPSLGGERREISVLFTDVAGFTTFSEARDPVELADITNQYLEGVCAAIFAHEGLVNAFMGDGVLAIFGAPQQQADHADRAVAAALAIDRFAEEFRMDQQSRGINFGHTRIGVHTGKAFVGNIGTQASAAIHRARRHAEHRLAARRAEQGHRQPHCVSRESSRSPGTSLPAGRRFHRQGSHRRDPGLCAGRPGA